MATYPKYVLTGKTPASTYEQLVQYVAESSSFANGDGNELSSLNITASVAISASYAPQTAAEAAGSSSWASSSISASYANNAAGAISNASITVHSQDAVYILATNNVFLSATGAMDMEADGGDISMYPSSSVKVYGNVDFVGTLTQNGSEYVPTSSISSSYALSASWAPGGAAFNGTASYFDNGNGATINGGGFANLGNILANDPSIPVIGLLSGGGYYQDDVHGRVGFNGRFDDTQPLSYFESSRIEGRKDANSPNYGGALVFMTSDSSGTMTERIKIDKTGNMNVIGTLSTNGTPGLTTTVYLTASVTTMSFVNGLLTSVS